MKKRLKVLGIWILIIFTFVLGCVLGCSDNNSNKKINIATIAPFDLNLLNDIAKKAIDANDFERKLNNPDVFYHNTDVDNDGNIDYLNVYETNENGIITFKIIDKNNNSNFIELAKISIDKSGTANIHGNPTYYGTNNHYQDRWSTGETIGAVIVGAALLNYALSPHTTYISPYSNYSRPPYVTYRKVIPQQQFVTRTQTLVKKVRPVTVVQSPIKTQSVPPIQQPKRDYNAIGNGSQFTGNKVNPFQNKPDEIKKTHNGLKSNETFATPIQKELIRQTVKQEKPAAVKQSNPLSKSNGFSSKPSSQKSSPLSKSNGFSKGGKR